MGRASHPPPMAEPSPTGAPWRNLYGRRRGKSLRDRQRRDLEALADLSPGPVGWEANPERRPLDLVALFGDRPVWLEIGFGAGEHLVHQAATHPEVGFIGAEPFVNGVAALMGKIRLAGLGNIRVHPGDARDLLDVMPEASLARAFLLYPDPWPKARHHRRRFVTPEHLEPLARTMAPGAELRLATDIPDYVRQALEEVPRAGLALVADTAEPWSDWLPTRYEQKALREGRAPRYLTFERG